MHFPTPRGAAARPKRAAACHPFSAAQDVVRTAHEQGILVAFHVERFPKGHAPTDYKRWLKAEEDYVVEYKEGSVRAP